MSNLLKMRAIETHFLIDLSAQLEQVSDDEQVAMVARAAQRCHIPLVLRLEGLFE